MPVFRRGKKKKHYFGDLPLDNWKRFNRDSREKQALQSTQYYLREGKKKHRYWVKLRRSCEPSCWNPDKLEGKVQTACEGICVSKLPRVVSNGSVIYSLVGCSVTYNGLPKMWLWYWFVDTRLLDISEPRIITHAEPKEAHDYRMRSSLDMYFELILR